MKKVGEHVTIDFLGVKRDYAPEFQNKVIYKIAKKAKKMLKRRGVKVGGKRTRRRRR